MPDQGQGGRKLGAKGNRALPIFGTMKSKAFSTIAQLWFVPIVVDSVLGPLSVPSSTHLTVSLYLCSSRTNPRGELRAIKGHCVSSESPSRVHDQDELRCWNEEKRIISALISYHCFALQAKNISNEKGTRINFC